MGYRVESAVMSQLQTDLLRLLSVVDASKWSGVVDETKSVEAILRAYSVGTQNAKPTPAPPPLGTKFEPLRSYRFQNPSQATLTKVKDAMEESKESACSTEDSLPKEPPAFAPCYERIVACLETLYGLLEDNANAEGCLSKESRANTMDCIGNRLSSVRASVQDTSFEASDRATLRSKLSEVLDNVYSRGKAQNISPENPTSDNISDNMEEPKAKKPRTKGGYSHGCSFVGCNKNDSMPGVKVTRVPPVPRKPLPGADRQAYINYHELLCRRKELLRRLGIGRKGTSRKEPRFCNRHQPTLYRDSVTVTVYNSDGTVKEKFPHTVCVWMPSSAGVESSLDIESTRQNRGVANVRQKLVTIEGVVRMESDAVDPATESEHREAQQLKAELASERLEKQRTHELTSPGADLEKVPRSLLEASGLDVHVKPKAVSNMLKFESTSTKKRKYAIRVKDATVNPFDLLPHQVQTRTGFHDVGMMLTFVLTVCNGDIDMMTRRVSQLTWFEEWFLYCEFVNGKTVPTMKAALSSYGIRKKEIVSKVVESKLALVLLARKSWPTYASLREDELLRKEKWNDKYRGKRPVFWDNTGVSLHKATDALIQRLTYSSYYSGNVAKGGVFVQLCGWLGTHELYPGAMSDTDYLNKTGILEAQYEFQEQDGGEPFVNVLDRGYRSTRAAWRNGQFVLQPTFAESDHRFSTAGVLHTACVAYDRSGNERAVRVSKMSSFVKRGTDTHKNLKRLCDVWLAWGYQANFMFKPVL